MTVAELSGGLVMTRMRFPLHKTNKFLGFAGTYMETRADKTKRHSANPRVTTLITSKSHGEVINQFRSNDSSNEEIEDDAVNFGVIASSKRIM